MTGKCIISNFSKLFGFKMTIEEYINGNHYFNMSKKTDVKLDELQLRAVEVRGVCRKSIRNREEFNICVESQINRGHATP